MQEHIKNIGVNIMEQNDAKQSVETRLAVIENDLKYIKEKLDSVNIGGIHDRLQKDETDIAVLKVRMRTVLWVLGLVTSTVIGGLTTAILKAAGVFL